MKWKNIFEFNSPEYKHTMIVYKSVKFNFISFANHNHILILNLLKLFKMLNLNSIAIEYILWQPIKHNTEKFNGVTKNIWNNAYKYEKIQYFTD